MATGRAFVLLLLLAGCRSGEPAAPPPAVEVSPPVRVQRIDRIVWRYTGGQHMGQAAPSPSGERVYVQAGAGSIRCLDAATGRAIWGGPGSPHFNYSSSVLGPGERSYGSAMNVLRCVDRDGALSWEADLGASWIHAPPAVSPDGKRVFVGGDRVGLAILDAGSGEVILRREGFGSHNGYGFDDDGNLLLRTDEGVECLGPEGETRWAWKAKVGDFLYLDGVLYAAEGNRVVAVAAGAEKPTWGCWPGGDVTGLSLDGSRGEILASLATGELVALGLDGRVLRRTRVSARPLAPPAAAGGGEAVVADADGVVTVVDREGAVVARVGTGAGPHWSWGGRPVVGPDGCVYFSQRNALLRLAAGPAGGSALSSWGEASGGIRCRASAPALVARGDRMAVTVEFRADAASLPPGTTHFDRYLLERRTRLRLRNGRTVEVRPPDPTSGMPPDEPDGTERLPIADGAAWTWEVQFPLAAAWEELAPGDWKGRVEVTGPRGFGEWSATVSTGDFPLAVGEPPPRTVRFLAPKRLTPRANPGNGPRIDVTYGPEDAEALDLPVRNGFIVGTKIERSGGMHGVMSGFPRPDDPNAVDQIYEAPGGPFSATYHIEVFETADEPVHMWSPGPGSGGYRVLWSGSFTVTATEEEMRALWRTAK